jgi:hypothetical protein
LSALLAAGHAACLLACKPAWCVQTLTGEWLSHPSALLTAVQYTFWASAWHALYASHAHFSSTAIVNLAMSHNAAPPQDKQALPHNTNSHCLLPLDVPRLAAVVAAAVPLAVLARAA